MSDLSASTVEHEDTTSHEITTKDENAPKLSELEQVENLLSGKKPETVPDTAPGREPAAAKESETDADADPETGDPDAKAVDYTQEIPLSNGQKMTLGELKDFYQAHDAKVVDLIERENKVMNQYRELQEYSQYLNLPPEAKQQIQQQQAQHLQEQHSLMLSAIPEWKDQASFEKGRTAIFELGKEYGVDLQQVTDHRVVKMLNDFTRLKAAIKTAKATVKPVRTPEPKAKVPPPRTRSTELSNAVDTAKRTGNIADQTKAVDLLLQG